MRRREEDGQRVIDELEVFYADVARLHADIDQLTSSLEDDLPAGQDVDLIKQQQNEFKVSDWFFVRHSAQIRPATILWGGIRIFSGKIRIDPYHFNIPHAKHRNTARNTVLLFITGTHK